MQNVVLIVHLLLALTLIGVVLLQRSEGGGGLMGGGSAATGRAAATPLGKVTWGLAAAFIATSMTLTLLAAAGGEQSVIDRLSIDAGTQGTDGSDAGGLLPPSGDALLPPPPAGGADDPALPPRAD